MLLTGRGNILQAFRVLCLIHDFKTEASIRAFVRNGLPQKIQGEAIASVSIRIPLQNLSRGVVRNRVDVRHHLVGINAYTFDSKNCQSGVLAGGDELLGVISLQKYLATKPHLSALDE